MPHLVQRYLQLRDEVYSMVERAAPDAEAYDRCERTADDVTMVIVTMLSRR